KHQPIGFKKSASLNGHVRRDPGLPRRGPLPEAQPRRTVVSLQERGGGDKLGSSQKLTKLLVHVTVQRSITPVNVIISPESTVGDLIKATLEVYAREGRRPLLSTTDPSAYELHFSQFILESLNPEERIMSLGSRNFFLCPKQGAPNNKNSSCANEAEKVRHSNRASPSRLLEIMDFLL
ncbi:Uncharacterized protein EJ110_NYTH16811, partial [Nymphaea thermarum]